MVIFNQPKQQIKEGKNMIDKVKKLISDYQEDFERKTKIDLIWGLVNELIEDYPNFDNESLNKIADSLENESYSLSLSEDNFSSELVDILDGKERTTKKEGE